MRFNAYRLGQGFADWYVELPNPCCKTMRQEARRDTTQTLKWVLDQCHFVLACNPIMPLHH